MRISEWLNSATLSLNKAGISSARLDSLILLEDELGHDRGWLLAHPEFEINKERIGRLNKKIARRARQTPLAYIRGFSEFYGRRFMVNKYVLEPRPESETMIEFLKLLRLPARPVIADVGTGSGALGITAKLEIPSAEVDLYDIDSNCLAVAKHNAALHELHLHVRKRDLLNRPLSHYDAVLANLPYVPTHWMTSPSIKLEPRLAIDGGKDGLDHYRRLFAQLNRQRFPPRYVLTEALPPQHESLIQIAAVTGYQLSTKQDLIQVFEREL